MCCRGAIALGCWLVCASVDGKGVWQTWCKLGERDANWFATVLVPLVSSERSTEPSCVAGRGAVP